MHLRRIAAFLLGGWLAGSAIVLIVCFGNLASVDQVMESKDAAVQRILARAGDKSARMFLNFLAATEDSRFLADWEITQAPLGLLTVAMLVFEKSSRRMLVALPVVMLLLVGFEHLLLTPEIAWLSEAQALGRDAAAVAQRGRLDNIFMIYGVTETVKMLVGLGMAALLFMMRSGKRRRRSSSLETDELMERPAAV
jgi:hypothetical protein